MKGRVNYSCLLATIKAVNTCYWNSTALPEMETPKHFDDITLHSPRIHILIRPYMATRVTNITRIWSKMMKESKLLLVAVWIWLYSSEWIGFPSRPCTAMPCWVCIVCLHYKFFLIIALIIQMTFIRICPTMFTGWTQLPLKLLLKKIEMYLSND